MSERLGAVLAPLRQAECRSLFAAQAVSGFGDWAGRLALAVLVFDRSNSAWWAASVTIVALLPWLGAGQLLSTYADRFGRIRVMVAADLARAAAFGLMLIPQSTWTLLVLAFLAGLCVPPFVGARSSALVEIVPRERYPSALALYGVLTQSEILVGYVVGGVLIASTGARTALAVNAVTFVLSALLLVRLRHSAASTPNPDSPVGWSGVRSGIAVWRTDPVCGRALWLFVGVAMFMVLPEALVVPFTSELDVGSSFVGVFAALVAVGAGVAMVFVPTADSHVALLRVAAVRAGLFAVIAGVLFAVSGSPWVGAAAFVLSGATDAIAVPTNQVVGERLPTAGRPAAMTVASGVMYTAQVASIALAGAVATWTSARFPLAVAMLAAAVVCVAAAVRPLDDPAATSDATA